MERARTIRGYRVIFALMTLAALAYQLYHLYDRGNAKPFNFFSFFTVESNIFAALVFLFLAARPLGSAPSTGLTYLRGAATLYMATTGVVYGVLLAGYQEALQTTIPWVDTVVHRVFPLVLVLDWLIDPPAIRLRFKRALVWLLYPLAFVVYSLIRGPIVDWYPYPFLDPHQSGGYAGVLAYATGIAIGIIAFTWLVVTAGNRLRLSAAPIPAPV